MDRPDEDNLFMTTAGPIQEQISNPADALDDVFGSAPNSPLLQTDDRAGGFPIQRSGPRSQDHSDVPRLRSIHVTNGYREGVALSKETSIQKGFDEGYSLGAEIGLKAGWCLGALDGFIAASNIGELREELSTSRQEALEDLKLQKLFGEKYFGADGIWLYDVPGQEREGEVTFEQVARAHPVLNRWTDSVLTWSSRLNIGLVDNN